MYRKRKRLKTENQKITLKIILERNANLLTVFGIFNAVILFGLSIPEVEFARTVACVFSIITVWIFIIIILDFNEGENETLTTASLVFLRFLLLGCFLLIAYIFRSFIDIIENWQYLFITAPIILGSHATLARKVQTPKWNWFYKFLKHLFLIILIIIFWGFATHYGVKLLKYILIDQLNQLFEYQKTYEI